MHLIERLSTTLAEFYQPGLPNGMVQVVLSDAPELCHYYEFSDTLQTFNGRHPKPDTILEMSKAMMLEILDNPTGFEPRLDSFSKGVKIGGDLNLMHAFCQLLKRPLPSIAQLCEQKHSADYDASDIVEKYTLSKTEALDAILNSQPTVFRQCIDWPAIQWDESTLQAHIGDSVIRHNPLTGAEETINDLIYQLNQSQKKRVYSNGCVLGHDAGQHFPFPLFEDSAFRPLQLWFGKKREEKLITKLHCDFVNSFLIQVWGRKKLWLYSPDQYKYLYAYKAYNIYQPCLASPDAPDFMQFPDFKKAQPLEIIVNPGDMLIIPAAWYHCVWALDNVLSVSRFMANDTAEALRSNLND